MLLGLLVLDRRSVSEAVANVLAGPGRGRGVRGPAGQSGQDDRLWVMQSASTAQMIFNVPRSIEFLSTFTTLRPGDVIATGTPGGVGFARQPPVWLEPGDLIEVEIEGVGRIANRVVAEQDQNGWPWVTPAAKTSTL